MACVVVRMQEHKLGDTALDKERMRNSFRGRERRMRGQTYNSDSSCATVGVFLHINRVEHFDCACYACCCEYFDKNVELSGDDKVVTST